MADLSFKAQIELIDRMTAPMRSLSSQANRLGRQFGETARQARQLQSQQRLVDSFRQQRRALEDTSDAALKNRERLQQLQQQMRATAHPSQTLVRQFQSAQRESERLDNRLTSQRQHLQQLRSRMADAGMSTQNLTQHEHRLAEQIERTNQQLGERRQRMERMRQLQQQSQQMGEMRNKAATLGAGGAAATYAAARFVQPGVDLETSMSKVQALTRLDKNSEQYKALEAQAKKLGASTQFTSADAARGQSFLAMAGFTPQSIQAAMPGMLDLALAGGMELDRTADIASNILTGMKLDPRQMTDVADVLSAAFTRANVDIGMLGETMKYAAPGAAGLGISLQEVAAMAGKLGDAGIQGSMGGTALRGIMSRLAAPTNQAQKALDRLGISTTDASGNLRPMVALLQEFDAKTKAMGTADRAAVFKQIAGEEAGNAFKILVEQAASGELQVLIDKLKGANGEAAQLAKTMSDNTAGDYKAMTSGLDALRTSVFDKNRASIREFIQDITKLAQRMTEFANAHPQLIAFMGKVFGIMAIGAVILGTVGAALLTVLGPMAMLRASLVTLGLPTSLSPIASLISGFKKFKILLSGFKIASMLNPIGISILFIAGLALVLINYWEPIKAFFTGLWNGIKEGLVPLQGVFNQLKSAFDPLYAAFQPLLPLFNTFKNALISLGVPLNFSAESMSKVQAVGHALGWALGTLITILARIISFYITGWTKILTAVTTIVTNLKNSITTAWRNINLTVINYANQLWSRLGIKFNSGIGALIGIILAFSPVGLFIRVFTAVWSWFGGLQAKFKQYGANIMQGLADGILGKANKVIKTITNIAGRIKSAFTSTRAMDIHSPSRVFDKYGANIMQGLGGGISRWTKWPIRKLGEVANKMRSQSFSFTPDINSSRMNKLWGLAKRLPVFQKAQRYLANYSPINLDTIKETGRYFKRNNSIISPAPIIVDTRKSILPGVGSTTNSYRSSTSNMSLGGITININGATDPMSVAQHVRQEFENIERERAARRRSRLSDID